MEETLIPRLLDKGLIDKAYPLVRNLLPEIALAQWNRFALRHTGSRPPNEPRGLMTIQNTTGYILGLFSFEARDDLQEGRILFIDNIIVPNMPGRDMIWTCMAQTVDHLGQINGCRAIRAEFIDEIHPSDLDQAWLNASLKGSGYSFEGMRALKRLGD